MKILFVDTYYPDFLKGLPFNPESSFEAELAAVLSHSFGTAAFFSDNLRPLGWDCMDVIANHVQLQQMWAKEQGIEPWGGDVLLAQADRFQPDVIFLQDLSLKVDYRPRVIAAQLSCPWPGNDAVQKCNVIFTSFPHYLARIEALGVRAVYLPLAFEPSVLQCEKLDVTTMEDSPFGPRQFIDGRVIEVDRDIDISFVGGVGRDSHWKAGTDLLETVAAAFPKSFHWYGYGLDRLSESSALRGCYKGEAWGREMYDIYRRSKIVINRHGEVAGGYVNNLRCFEATGCGAMLLTEESSNLYGLFTDGAVGYSDPDDAVRKIAYYLRCPADRKEVAAKGQKTTLERHNYAQRMKVVSETLKEML